VTGERKNQIIELNVRNVAYQDSTAASAAFAVMAAIAADADLPNKALVTGQLPTS
jgi:phage-related baseplate assembly protein